MRATVVQYNKEMLPQALVCRRTRFQLQAE
jgi:hypothetical protein